MTVTDRLKIIDNKIKVNQAQYDLDRLTAKTSVCFSGDLRNIRVILIMTVNLLFTIFTEA